MVGESARVQDSVLPLSRALDPSLSSLPHLPPSLPLSSSHSISIFPLCSPPVPDNRLTPSRHRLSASASLSCSLAPFKRYSLSLPLSLSASAASVRLCLHLPLPSAPLLPLPLLLRLRLRGSSTSVASLHLCHPLPLCSLLRPFSLSLSFPSPPPPPSPSTVPFTKHRFLRQHRREKQSHCLPTYCEDAARVKTSPACHLCSDHHDVQSSKLQVLKSV